MGKIISEPEEKNNTVITQPVSGGRKRASTLNTNNLLSNTGMGFHNADEGDWRQKYPPFEYASESSKLKDLLGLSPPSRLSELLGGNGILPNKALVETIKNTDKRVRISFLEGKK